MSAIDKIKAVFRRKPMTDEELRAQRDAKLAEGTLRRAKSPIPGVGEYDSFTKGGRGRK
jgi:hypothetical protein